MIRRFALFLATVVVAAIASAQTSDLHVAVSGPSSVATGSSPTYTSNVGNYGPNAVSNVQLNLRVTSYSGDILVSNLHAVSTPAGFTCAEAVPSPQGPTIFCDASSLASGYTGALVVSWDAEGTSGGFIVSSQIIPIANDPDTSNNSSGVGGALIVPQADLNVSLDGPTTVASGTSPSYTATFGNTGPDPASNFQLSTRVTSLSGDVVVSNLHVVSAPAQVTCGAAFATPQGPTINCTAASLPSGFSGAVTYAYDAEGNGGTFSVFSSVTPITTDPNTPDNSDGIGGTLTAAHADLAASTSTASAPTVTSGTTVTYTTAYRNDGPDAAVNPSLAVRFTSLSGNILPTNIQITSAPAGFTCSAPVATPQGPTITCTAPSLASGASGSTSMSATITGTSGTLNVCSTFVSSTDDTNTNGATNGSCVTTALQVVATPTTSLSCPGTFNAGTNGSATVTLSSAQGTSTTITLMSSNPAVATVPASVVIPAGQTSATFAIHGVSAGAALITATPPAGFGTAQSCTAQIVAEGRGVESVPTLSTWALLALSLILGAVAFRALQ